MPGALKPPSNSSSRSADSDMPILDEENQVPSLSQQSSYSDLPDISDIILAASGQIHELEIQVPSLSQQSSYSDLPDISDIILAAPVGTQLMKSISTSVSTGASIQSHARQSSDISNPPSSSVPSKSSSPKTSFSRSDSNTSGGSGSASASSNSLFSRTSSNTSTTSAGSSSSVRISRERIPIAAPKTVLGKRKASVADSPLSVSGPAKPSKAAKLAAPDWVTGEPVIISHSPKHQRLFNALGLPYGVRYEIARIAATSNYDALDKSGLEKLQGLSNAKAVPAIPRLFGAAEDSGVDEAFAKEIAAKAPWAELDLEAEYLSKNEMAGLGLSEEAPDWFGGKVHFTGKLIAEKHKKPPFKVVLKTPELGPSDRFARRWGSDRFLTLSLSKDVLRTEEKVIDFLCHPFVLGDRVFRAFDAKDGNVFMFCTNEIVEGRRINTNRTLPGGLSLQEFLAWHNPLELNPKQTMAKWASRFALGRSNSAPVLRLEEDAIIPIPDIESESGSDMTDGAGLINKAGLRLIYDRVEMDSWPTAIQCRVVGAKGLLVMHPTDVHETPRIWIRPSQIKVKHPRWDDPRDPTLRTVDLLRSSSAKTQCRLPVETIINLAENGVPARAFIKLVEEALVNVVTPLITWEGTEAMPKLWWAVARAGGVMSSRLARKETILARVKGLSERDSGDLENEEEESNDQPTSTAWWVDQISGCPSSLEETVMYLLDAGFTPETCSVLRSKLHIVVQGCINRYIDSYRIDLPVGMSAMAFLVPDELGVLEPGEFFFRSSRHNFQTRDGLPTDILLGDALITRHPCKLPTDVQKWKGVDHPELRNITNVIVLPVKGPRRAADYLAGGDMDGDKGLVIWQPELVDPFVNAPLSFSEEPPEVAACFKEKNATVREFLERTAGMTPGQRLLEMQKQYLLSSIRDRAVVGKYSNWHINATYSLGYDHPETIRLAYMFCKTLDGAKTGLSVRPDVFSADTRRYDKRAPMWKEATEKKKDSIDQTNTMNLARDPKLHQFIMDRLHNHTEWGKGLQRKLKGQFKMPHIVDADLTAPWYAFVEQETTKQEAYKLRNGDIVLLAQYALNTPDISATNRDVAERLLAEAQARPESDLERIKRHVETIQAQHKMKITGKFTGLTIERRQDILRELSREFAAGPSELSMNADEAARIKASYAYVYDLELRQEYSSDARWSRFPWDVAFRELCLIKCKSRDTSFKPVNSEFYERFTMKMRRV